MRTGLSCLLALMPACSAAMAADLDRGLYESPYEAQGFSGKVAGNVEASFSKGKTDLFDLDNETWALRGSVNYDAGNGFNIQADADYGRTEVEDFDFDRLSGAAHVYYRPSGSYAVGLFGQAGRYSTGYFNGLGIPGLDTSVTDKLGGLEVAWFNEVATTYGQLGYGKTSWAGEDADHILGRLGIRYFLTDDVRFDLEGSLHRFSYDNVDLDVKTLKTVANYRPGSIPVSVFAGYRYDEWEPSASGVTPGKEKDHSVFAGLRYHFGSTSLKDEENSGPVWSTTSLLP